MKNREYKKVLAAALITAMVGSMTGTATMQVRAADSLAAKPTKTETVYAKIDETGSVKNVTVSDQLKNVTAESKIDDVSTLSDIQNLKGDETFKQSSDSLTWNGDGKEIVYSGTGKSSDLPLEVKITYTLDGKEISASELEGKSGHLVIRYDYTNLSEANTGEFVPFLMATGIIIDGDTFTNITTTNAKLASDGDRDLVIGYGFPGVAQELATDIDIPDYFEMEADVTDYTAPQSVTFGTNDVFNEIDTDEIDSMDDLKDAMTQLSDASNQLVDGSGQLKDGMDTLLDRSGTLVSGVDQLASGGNELASGVNQLSAGSQTLAGGAGQLADGSRTLSGGAGVLAAGTDELVKETAGAPAQFQYLNSVAQQLAKGSSSLKANSKDLGKSGLALQKGLQSIEANINYSGPDENGKTQETILNSLSQLSNIMDQIILPSLKASQPSTADYSELERLVNDLPDSSSGNQTESEPAVSEESNSMTETGDRTLTNSSTETSEPVLAETYTQEDGTEVQVYTQTVTVTNDYDTTTTVTNTNTTTETQTNTVEKNADIADTKAQLLNEISEMREGAQADAQTPQTAYEYGVAVNNGLKALISKIQLQQETDQSYDQNKSILNAMKVLDDNMTKFNEALSGEKGSINAGIDTMASSLEGLAAGTETLPETGTKLAAAASKLQKGANQVSTGAAAVSSNLATLSTGADTLATGLAAAGTGADTLSAGIQTLQAGTPELVSGITQLDDGAAQLNRGMIEFDESGIDKLTAAFDDNLDGLFDKLSTMLDSSKSYKNYSGLSDEMEGSVKFVFVTDSATK
ncbi:MAG: hypothetical protein PHQ72_02560 [Hespellia sp.]|nr:hypothetical protein [Hespellia sp.]